MSAPFPSPSLETTLKPLLQDFVRDLTTTFPEKAFLWSHWAEPSLEDLGRLFDYFKQIYPERFFDILYKNDDIFSDPKINTCFLPHVQFSELYKTNISETTRQAIWKYLQTILFQVVGDIQSRNDFGEAADLFQGVSETDLQDKIKETMENLREFFEPTTPATTESDPDDETKPAEEPRTNPFANLFRDMNPNTLQDKLKELMGGKIGAMVQELVEELKEEFAGFEQDLDGLDPNNASMQEVLKKLMQNPGKLMGIMKKMADKVKNKMQGENSEEFMRETSNLFKEMGGREGFMQMFEQMKRTMPGGGKNMRMNMNALRKMEEQEKFREKMQKKMAAKKAAAASTAHIEATQDGRKVFRVEGETPQEKTTKEDIDRIMKEFGLEEETAHTKQATTSHSKKQGKKNKKK